MDYWVKEADTVFNGTARAREALDLNNLTKFNEIVEQVIKNNSPQNRTQQYFMKASKKLPTFS